MYLQSFALAGAALCGVATATASAAVQDKVFKHVAVFSIDGLHSSDIPKWVALKPQGTIAKLLEHGYWYQNALTSSPSDSFPGTINLVTGASPRNTGIWYDDSYDRTLWAPKSNCAGAPGAETVLYDESIDYDDTKLWSSPNPTVVGGNINPANLPMGKVGGVCKPIYPHQHVRVNTVFEVAHGAGMQTAYTDKHPAYDLVRGPSGEGLSVGYFPEIQSLDSTNVSQIITYDTSHVNAFLAWIKGQTPANTEIQEKLTGMPALFGGNFQAVSVAQKTHGYKAGSLAFTDPLATAVTFVDNSLGSVVDALTTAGVYNDTLIFVCAKHGQAPIDPTTYRKIDNALIAPATGVNVSQVTADDLAMIWLANQNDLDKAVDGLEKAKAALQIDRIISGELLTREGYGDPKTDPAVPDIIVVPQLGVIYTTSTAKIAEHGGFSLDDTNVACFVSSPVITDNKTYTGKVSTKRVAPTILKALGLDPGALQGVKLEDTDVLPGFGGSDSDDE
ncbi:type I phosphodiesterase [Diplogelasinospora grovesii]|uniref:Type I phosphodiesterase n=1 Tax=Diplogelasinospora grovesii TaxID=303347 RepID=A0AAN6N4B4_9PEZI|nr:type I phosphodiesterase [Diplogelasinospora grovesii]